MQVLKDHTKAVLDLTGSTYLSLAEPWRDPKISATLSRKRADPPFDQLAESELQGRFHMNALHHNGFQEFRKQ